ncbi:MAG: 2Fe-2S iron-sulfur cluster binding domain-containing protein [Chloroflexi bacterium]|nr:2Fe-2S iron-sulfur cluster binding domain-containing protein [Chloroflexota bacterium]
MPNVRVTIDGREVSVPAGSTILDAASVAGVEIDQLCAHAALKPIGACRICLVEVEKQRVLQPACTFPVSDGMVVHTDTDRVKDARRFVLQLLFSERNHFCMYCQMSGSCELQDLAYKYQLTHWEYDRGFPKLGVDASRKYFVMDHNRCILCRRCIRACDELVGNGTLGLKNRGAQTMVIADFDVPFGESSCVACGSCLQVCPTGALGDRASAYMGNAAEITRAKSRCMACPVGCGVELIVRDNRVIRVEGDWDAEPNRGLLCELGRFVPLYDQRRRLYTPLVKNGAVYEQADWDVAAKTVAAKLKAAGDGLVTVVSGFATSEAAAALKGWPGKKVQLEGAALDGNGASLADLDEADLFVVINTDLSKSYQVAGFAIKRAVRNRGARLVLLTDGEDGMANWATAKWPAASADQVLQVAKDAQAPVILAGPDGLQVAQALAKKLARAKMFIFSRGGNALGLAAAGIGAAFDGQKASAYYVVAGEAYSVDAALLNKLKAADFVVVQTSYREPWEGIADVLLPSPTMAEKSGTMTNVEGKTAQVTAGVKTKRPSEVEVIQKVGALL